MLQVVIVYVSTRLLSRESTRMHDRFSPSMNVWFCCIVTDKVIQEKNNGQVCLGVGSTELFNA